MISALLIYLVYSQNFIFGSSSGKWTYSFFNTVTPIPRWIPISVLILLALTLFFGSKLILSHEKVTLIGCFVMAFIIQSLIFSVYPASLDKIIQSNVATSFYSQAMRYTPLQILTHYNDLLPAFPEHSNSNMPGKILLFQFFKLLTSSPQAMGYLVILLSTLGAPLLYGICKMLFHDRLTAFYALLLYALVPCKLFFLPILNSVTPIFLLLCLFLFLVYIERKQTLFLWLSGCALFILILFDPAPLVAGFIFIGILINAILEKRILKKDLWRVFLIPIISFLIVYILFWVFFSFNLGQVVQTILKNAENFNLKHRPSYLAWVEENPKEFFYGVGLPIMMIAIYQVMQIASQFRQLKYISGWSIENVYILSFLMTFCILVFLGINRGEITRLWIYLAVLFQIPASFFMAKMPHSKLLFFLVATTLVAQSLITLNRVSFINP